VRIRTPLIVCCLVLAVTAPAAHAAPDINTVLDLTFPVAGNDYRYTDTYWAPRSGGTRAHKGTDVMAPSGTPVHAAVGGTISWITGLDGNPPSYGYMMTIRGDDGLEHSYVHLGTQTGSPSEAYAAGMARGVRVERGQHIGYLGCSGNASCSAPHLHYDIEDPRYPPDDDDYDHFRYNPYPSLQDAEARGDVPGASRAITVQGAGTPGRFHPLPPARILDTREGVGAPTRPVRGGETITVDVTGVGGVPEDGVVAVAVNVTVTEPTRYGYVTVYPTGEPRPTASNVNFVTGQTIPNMAIVKVGTDGTVDLFNFAGDTHVLFDVAGYFTDVEREDGGAGYVPANPERILDTRRGVGGPKHAIGHRGTRVVQVAGVGQIPATGIEAVVLNVTATRSTASSSYLTVYPTGQKRPTTSNLNFPKGKDFPNLAITKLGDDGTVTVYNHSGSTHVLFDVAGYYRSGAPGTFVPVTPTRVLDTRNGTGAAKGTVQRGLTLDLSGIRDPDATAVVLNVTATKPTLGSYLTVYPSGTDRPVASNLNWDPVETIPNLVVVRLGSSDRVELFNYVGSTHVVADVAGYMTGG
jgi:murein DD-endopeptidase MepM/ murein hydrolase activator NlpD